MTVVGSKRMATFDDMAIERSRLRTTRASTRISCVPTASMVRLGPGDVWSPAISNEEPLRIECRHFVESIREGRPARSGPASGLRVVGCRGTAALTRGELECSEPCDRAPGLALGEDVVLPHDVELGANVVIHAGTAIGAGVRVHDVGHPRANRRRWARLSVASRRSSRLLSSATA